MVIFTTYAFLSEVIQTRAKGPQHVGRVPSMLVIGVYALIIEPSI